MNRSQCAKARKRRVLAVVIALVAIVAIVLGARCACATYAKWQKSLPLLCIEDSYGHVTKIHKSYDQIVVTGPARVWSDRYGLGIVKEDWEYPQFQLTDTSVELRTQNGRYTIFLQPAGFGEVSHDLKKSKGEITISLR